MNSNRSYEKWCIYTSIPKSIKAFNVLHFWARAFINVSSILDGDVLYTHWSATMASLQNSITVTGAKY